MLLKLLYKFKILSLLLTYDNHCVVYLVLLFTVTGKYNSPSHLLNETFPLLFPPGNQVARGSYHGCELVSVEACFIPATMNIICYLLIVHRRLCLTNQVAKRHDIPMGSDMPWFNPYSFARWRSTAFGTQPLWAHRGSVWQGCQEHLANIWPK